MREIKQFEEKDTYNISKAAMVRAKVEMYLVEGFGDMVYNQRSYKIWNQKDPIMLAQAMKMKHYAMRIDEEYGDIKGWVTLIKENIDFEYKKYCKEGKAKSKLPQDDSDYDSDADLNVTNK